jgi:hypothetical protein
LHARDIFTVRLSSSFACLPPSVIKSLLRNPTNLKPHRSLFRQAAVQSEQAAASRQGHPNSLSPLLVSLLLPSHFLETPKTSNLNDVFFPQVALQSEQAAASAHARDVELDQLRSEVASSHHRIKQLTEACRSLQSQLSRAGADVALPARSEGSPEALSKRKRSRVDATEIFEGGREVSGGVAGGLAERDARVLELEAALGRKERVLEGKLRELQEKEAEVRGLQEILRVLAHQLEEAEVEETPVKGEPLSKGGAAEAASQSPESARKPLDSGGNPTPPKSLTSSLSLSVDGGLLSAMKAALKSAIIAGGPRNSLEVARAVVLRREPLEGSPGALVASKERLALKGEVRELYDRLEQKEEEMERRLAEQTAQYRAAEREVLGVWREKEAELGKELEGKAMKLQVMEEAFQVRLSKPRRFVLLLRIMCGS